MSLSSRALDLFSRGILEFKNGDTSKVLAAARIVGGAALFGALLPEYLAAETARKINFCGSEYDGYVALPQMTDPQETDEQLSIIDLNAALGDKILYAVNFGGTSFGHVPLEHRARQLIIMILREMPDFVTLQEVFSVRIGRMIAEALSTVGYQVFYNIGSRYIGYGSGLLTAVRIMTAKREIVDYEFHAFDDAANVDRFASKGVLMIKVKIDDEWDVVVANTHMMASDPEPTVEVGIRDRQIRQSVKWINDFQQTPSSPVIFAGDFNCYDHGVNQAKEWLVNEKNLALGIESTNRDYLREYQESYLFNVDLCESSGMPLSLMLVGSGVEDAKLGKRFDDFVDEIDNEPMPEIESDDYSLVQIFVRLFRYRYDIGSLSDVHRYMNQEIRLIVQNRGLHDFVMPDENDLHAKISILLQGRDSYDLWTELQILGERTDDDDTDSEKLRELLAAKIVQIIEKNLDLRSCDKINYLRNKAQRYIGLNRNDRIFHKDLSGFYSVMYDQMHLSDHIPLIGFYSHRRET